MKLRVTMPGKRRKYSRQTRTFCCSLLMIFCWLLCSPPGRAQDSRITKISLQVQQQPLSAVFKEIEQKTGFTIEYRHDVINTDRQVSIHANEEPVQKVLGKLLNGTSTHLIQQGKSILIIKDNKPASSGKDTTAPKKSPGKVTGKIIDEETGQPIAGATIHIGSRGIISDENGTFIISLPKGKYEAEISAVGFGTKKITEIILRDSEIFSLNIPLKREKGQLSTVTVSARRLRETGTNTSIVNEIREADAVVSGISKEQISRSQDRDAAEVVRRISGVSIIQNRLIVIRGLPQRYNTVMLNNVIAPSFDPDSRAFSFDIMPSGLIDRVMIYKTAVPELPGDFAGGVIKVYTTDVPVRNSFNVSYSSSYNANTTFRDFYEQKQGKKAWLGYDDGTYALPKGTSGRIDAMSVEEQRRLTPLFNDHWDAH